MSKNTGELIYIQTDILTVTIKGNASHPSFPGTNFVDKDATLQISCDDIFELNMAVDSTPISKQHLGKSCIEQYRHSPVFFEQQQYEIVIEPEEGHIVEFWHENYNIRKNVTPVGRKSNMLSGIINFGNDIGYSDLFIKVDGTNYLKMTIEVFPSKIGYKDDYKAIMADVMTELYSLIFDFLKKTYDSFDISSKQQSTPVEFFSIIRKIYKEFVTAADMVNAKPNHVLEREYLVLPGYKVKRTDNRTVRWIEKHPEQVLKTNKGIMIDRALSVEKHITYDTNENRMTKYILKATMKRLENFKSQYMKLARETDVSLINQLDNMIQGIRRRYSTGFMREVEAIPTKSSMSLVFNMAPGYRELYRYYLLLQHGLYISGSIFNVSVKDLAVLYEYWCFIKLNNLMKERYELISQDIIKVVGNGLFVSLVKGQRSRVRYRNPENGELITLSYNPKEIAGATVPQKPDNVLSLKKKGAKFNYEYVFDAKYKINPALKGSMYQQMYNTPGPQEEDINTMHRYRDAIVNQNDASPYERTMFGAYVLFPYRNQEEYKQHRFYKSIDQVNIGGLPFLPSATDLVTEMLDELISDSPESAFERATLPIGIEERLARVDWNKRDVLIGGLQSHAQFEACLKNNFYYIPCKSIKNNDLPIHYVALFQIPRIFSNNAGIYYYGEVLRSTIEQRKDIQGFPINSNTNPVELYYRLDVSEWISLDKPILPKESGFANEFTNLFLLENCEFIPELLLQSEEEYRLYTELKRRTGKVLEENETKTGFELGSLKVLFEDGDITLFRNGKLLDCCTLKDFSRHPNAMFRRLQRYVAKENE